MIKFDIVTLFPEQIKAFLSEGVFRIASEKGSTEFKVWNLRDWSPDKKHRKVDNHPFGGGPGMVIGIESVFNALKDLRTDNSKVIVFTPRGEKLDQKILKTFQESGDSHFILLCGHYEGFDERVHEHLVDIELSIGDFVLSGGELPALVLMDGITRLIPGVLGNEDSLNEESFENDLLEYPQYTRPADFNGWKVPDVLLNGNHKMIDEWRKSRASEKTKKSRPDLLK